MASLSTCHLGLWLGWQILLNLVNATYIREKKRTLGTRIKEHKEDAEKASASRRYTWSNRKTSKKEMHKSAITDHDSTESHSRLWGGQICRQRVGLENKRHQRSDMDKKNQRRHESRWGPILTRISTTISWRATQGAAAGGTLCRHVVVVIWRRLLIEVETSREEKR